jgi:glycolate oxidase FAD binding subunit
VVKQASLASDLASIVGRENTAPGTHDYAVDGLAPKSVVRPGTAGEVAGVIRYANANQLAVIPLGGRNHAGIGNLPERYDLALDVTRLDSVVEFEPADLTITCQAGITLGALRQATGAANMMVPFDPSLPDGATVGGVLAGALSGPSRMSFGAPRDFTIGMRVVTADGKLTRAGGKVVKNVAGYDLCKLYIGSLGTLGVIVEASFKTVPLPQAEQRLEFDFDGPAAACALVSRAASAGLGIRATLLIREPDRWRLHVALAGMSAAVQRSARDLEAWHTAASLPSPAVRRGGGEGPGVRAPAPLPGNAIPESQRNPTLDSAKRTSDSPLVARLSVLPSKLPALLAAAASLGAVEGQPANGVCRLSLPEATAEVIAEVRALAASLGAACLIERCSPDLKRDIDVFGDAPPSLSLMRAIKAEFDPNGVLSPGRFVGKI